MNEMAPLEKLRIADPETHVRVTGRLALLADRPDDEWLARVVDDMIWALTQEAGLGRSVSDGLMRLVERGDPSKTTVYMDRVREAARTGPALGRILSDHLAAVLLADPPLLEPFTQTLAIMRTKGTYTLKEPLAVLNELLETGEPASARAYLDLLATLFKQQISYNMSVRLVYVVPRAVRSFVPRRRAAQIDAFVRVVETDLQLVDAFLEGMQNGLGLLAPRDLNDYLDQALAKYHRSVDAGLAFIGLSSKAGQETYDRLLVVVPLAQVKGPLDRYLNARIGRPVIVKAISSLPQAGQSESPRTGIQWIASDGKTIYLADEIDRFGRREDNLKLAKMLVRLEAGYFENGTFAFDLERAADLYPEVAEHSTRREQADGVAANDLLRFINGFDHPPLAEDLFDLFAQARTMVHLAGHYPGLMKQALPLLQAEALLLKRSSSSRSVLGVLYDHLVLDMPIGPTGVGRHHAPLFQTLAAEWRGHLNPKAPIECCARLVCLAYDACIAELHASGRRYERLTTPFGRRLHWNLVARASAEQHMQAARIKVRLAEQGLAVYLSDVQDKLNDGQGRLCAEDVRSLVLSRARIRGRQAAMSLELNEAELNLLLEKAGVQPAWVSGDDATGFRYPEWNDQLQDYLHDHVRVQESLVPAGGNGDFYRRTLDHYRGLVAHIRRAFEYLKPEGLTILRQWPDGDAFDHRALIDFAVDLRSGRTPSDRLFIKRLKHERDVAVLLLVDLSRSTANPVVGGRGTVLEVAKEALVLFCEALQVVGDTFAIAGFSGTGRHSVDYFRIKGFDDPFAGKVQARLSALTPQRSTRMGAAIRHATACLAPVASRVRLVIIVSDGFPNDLGYKADYAIADTRRAVQEARAKSIHVKAITVNIGSDPRLDDLYGRQHHHVIGDVRELPDKLVRLYGTLTKRF